MIQFSQSIALSEIEVKFSLLNSSEMYVVDALFKLSNLSFVKPDKLHDDLVWCNKSIKNILIENYLNYYNKP